MTLKQNCSRGLQPAFGEFAEMLHCVPGTRAEARDYSSIKSVKEAFQIHTDRTDERIVAPFPDNLFANWIIEDVPDGGSELIRPEDAVVKTFLPSELGQLLEPIAS